MPHIHYKFSSKLSYDTVVFDGPHITLEELKRLIMGREKLRAADCDLQITNAQSKEEFTDDNSLIHKDSSVIVRRIPISGVKPSPSSKTHNIEQSDVQHHHAFGASRAMDDQSSTGALTFFSKMQMANLVDADASEEDKIKFMIYQSAYDSMGGNSRLGTALPMNYTCYRCGNTGHHIRNCPTSGQDKNFEAPPRLKKSTGIPRSFMVEVHDPTMKGAMLTKCGRYAIPTVDAEAYAIGKKEKPPFIPQEQPKSEDEEDSIPEELLCLICGDLLSDCVVIPCCGNSYCDDCIRTTLLDSEDHVCPSCGQSDVSPDTLVANKFLRQAINTFKREQSHTKTLKRKSDASQTQNSTPTPNPVATPPPAATQNLLQKPQQPPNSQQDSLLELPKATNSPASSQASGPPPALTGPESAHSTPISSLQPVQNSLETSDKESEGNTLDDSATPSSVLVSNKDPTDAPSEPTPPVNHTVVAEQPQTVSVNQQPSSADRASRLSGSSNSWDSSSSSSGYPSSLLSSPYPATPPPLFPSPLFHTFLLAHQSHGSYPPGYPPATPVWTLPTHQGAPIPPLCSPNSTSSIPALIPKEWYRYQRKKKERSPHRGSGYRRPSSHSNSRSSTSKSSHSYSRSSSRSGSRSRSRSHSKSRPRSPYSRQRDCRTRSPPSCSYTFGYKRSRSPTPSSSSSPRVGYHSRSKSPSGSWKNRHHSKKSASSSYSSRRRGECSERESGGSRSSLTRNLYGQHTNQTSSQDLDRENYMQWKYKEWYEKYFGSYVGQFPQMPLPFVNILPPPCHQLEDREESRNHSHANLDSRYRPQGKHATRVDTRSPLSESSSDSRSPPSQSSSDSLSTPSYSSSGSRSSLSHKATDSRSPPSHSSSDGRSTPSEDAAQSCTGKHKSPTVTPTRNSEDIDMQDRSTDDKQPILKNLEHFSTREHEHKRMKKVDKGRGEDSSSLDSTDDSRKGQSRMSSGSSSCKDNTPEKNKTTDKNASESPPLKLNKPSDKDYERKVKGEKNLETEKGSRRGKDSESRHKEERQPRKREPDRVNTDREKSSGGCRAPDSRSEKNRKRKGENLERNEKESSLSFKPESSKCLKTEAAENLETYKSESLKPLDREEKKKEKKIWPLMEGDIWEGGMEVKPQRKISININLGGKRQEEKSDKQDPSYFESITGKSQENIEHTAIREEMLTKDKIETDVNEKKESSRDQEILSEVKIKSEEDRRKMWDKATFVLEKTADKEDSREEKEKIEEDFDLWHCALSGVEESVEGKGEEAEKVTDDCREEEMGGLAISPLKEKTEKESVYKETRGEADYTARFNSQRSERKSHHDGSTSTPDDGSSAFVVSSCGGEDRQERWTVVTTVEESAEDRAADVFIQVPRSKQGNEGKKEQDEGEIRVHTVALPQPSVTNKETGGDKEEQRRWSTERGRDGVMVRGRDREKKENAASSWSHRSVAPSSGKNTTDSTSCSERERQRDRERVRERSNKSKRSKEETKKEERRRDGERERDRSSSASKQRRNPSSSSHSISMSQHKEKRDHRRDSNQGGDSGKFTTVRSIMTSRATDLPDHSAHRPYRDVESKSEDHFHCGSYQERSGNSRHQDRSAGTHPSPPPSSLSHSKVTDLLLFESSAGPKRRSPNWGVMQNKSRNDSEVEEGEWKQNTVDKVVKKGKGEREKQEMVAGGSWWEDEDDKLEDEERPSSQSSSSSSSTSSTSQRSKDDQTNERKKKERKYEKEKRREVMEEGDLMQEKKRGRH